MLEEPGVVLLPEGGDAVGGVAVGPPPVKIKVIYQISHHISDRSDISSVSIHRVLM